MQIWFRPEKFTLLPSGIYQIKFECTAPGIGHFQQKVIYPRYSIVSGPYKSCFIKDIINEDSNGLNGRIWQMVRAFSGSDPHMFLAFELDSLIGKECYANIEKRGKNNVIVEYRSCSEIKNLS